MAEFKFVLRGEHLLEAIRLGERVTGRLFLDVLGRTPELLLTPEDMHALTAYLEVTPPASSKRSRAARRQGGRLAQLVADSISDSVIDEVRQLLIGYLRDGAGAEVGAPHLSVAKRTHTLRMDADLSLFERAVRAWIDDPDGDPLVAKIIKEEPGWDALPPAERALLNAASIMRAEGRNMPSLPTLRNRLSAFRRRGPDN